MKTLFKRTALAAMICLSTPALASVAYVSNEKDNTLSVIDTETQEVIETIDVGQRHKHVITTWPDVQGLLIHGVVSPSSGRKKHFFVAV